MYASRSTQIIVGLFALAGIAALAILSLRVGRVELFSAPGYSIYAYFDNVSGLQENDAVTLAGVKVGKVESVTLSDDRAKVAMRLNEGVKVDEDAIAAIHTQGIIGGKYIELAPGPGERILKAGDTLRQTESSFVLETAIGQLINSLGSGKGGGKGDSEKGGGKEAAPSSSSSAGSNVFPSITPEKGAAPAPHPGGGPKSQAQPTAGGR